MDLEERHPKNGHPSNVRIRSEHIPIHPSKAHPDNGSLLYLSKRSRLSKDSYLKTTPQRTVKAAVLRPTRDPTCRLKRKSLKKLIKLIGFESPWGVLDPIPQPAHRPLSPRITLPESFRYVSAPPSNTCHADFPTLAQRPYYVFRPDQNIFHVGERSPLLRPNDDVGASTPREEPPCVWKSFTIAVVCMVGAVCLYGSGILGSVWVALTVGFGWRG